MRNSRIQVFEKQTKNSVIPRKYHLVKLVPTVSRFLNIQDEIVINNKTLLKTRLHLLSTKFLLRKNGNRDFIEKPTSHVAVLTLCDLVWAISRLY